MLCLTHCEVKFFESLELAYRPCNLGRLRPNIELSNLCSGKRACIGHIELHRPWRVRSATFLVHMQMIEAKRRIRKTVTERIEDRLLHRSVVAVANKEPFLVGHRRLRAGSAFLRIIVAVRWIIFPAAFKTKGQSALRTMTEKHVYKGATTFLSEVPGLYQCTRALEPIRRCIRSTAGHGDNRLRVDRTDFLDQLRLRERQLVSSIMRLSLRIRPIADREDHRIGLNSNSLCLRSNQLFRCLDSDSEPVGIRIWDVLYLYARWNTLSQSNLGRVRALVLRPHLADQFVAVHVHRISISKRSAGKNRVATAVQRRVCPSPTHTAVIRCYGQLIRRPIGDAIYATGAPRRP